jgi:hypothetical protein
LAKSRERIFADDNEKEKRNFKDKNTQGGLLWKAFYSLDHISFSFLFCQLRPNDRQNIIVFTTREKMFS